MNPTLYKVRPFASIKVRFQTRILEVVRNFKMSQQARAYTRVKTEKKRGRRIKENKRIRTWSIRDLEESESMGGWRRRRRITAGDQRKKENPSRRFQQRRSEESIPRCRNIESLAFEFLISSPLLYTHSSLFFFFFWFSLLFFSLNHKSFRLWYTYIRTSI